MTPQRARELEVNHESKLTAEEISEGWHFCPDWDGMLVNRFDDQAEGAGCLCPRGSPPDEEDTPI